MSSVHHYPTLIFFILILLHPTFLTTTTAETQTKLHFYFHDIVSGDNPTAITIAKPENQTEKVGFGTLVMIDDPLTDGPDTGSKLVGRAEGMYGQASQRDSSLFMAITLSFKGGEYDGSSLSVMGRYHVSDPEREMPIIGGSGVFRMARGYALVKTYKYDPKTGDATSEYNVFVRHSETSSVDRFSNSGTSSLGRSSHSLLFSALCLHVAVLVLSSVY